MPQPFLTSDLSATPMRVTSCGSILLKHHGSSAMQTVWETIFEDAAALRSYHAEANHDPEAEVGVWCKGQRTVTFCTPLQAPDIVKKSLGAQVGSIQRSRILE